MHSLLRPETDRPVSLNALSLTAWCAALFISSALFAHDVALRLVLLAAALACAATAAVKHRRELALMPPICWPYLLWGIWAALSIAWSLEPGRSEKEFRNEVVYVMVGFLACYIGAQARNARHVILPVLYIAAVLVSVVALYYFALDPEAYADGWHGGPGNFSSTVLSLFPCGVMAAWYARKSGQRMGLQFALVASLALFVAGAYTTQNRTVWLAIAIQAVLMALVLRVRIASTGAAARWRPLTGAIIVIVLATGAVMALFVQTERPRAFSDDLRLKVWPLAVEQARERPLTGYGFGRGLLRDRLTTATHEPQLWHAHNLFIDVWLQTGLIGLVLFLYLLASIVRTAWRATVNDGLLAVACGVASLAVVAGMIVRNMTDTLLVRQNSLLYWAVLGLLMAWATEPEKRGG